ncbi:hypothetical protein [Geodermatophilus sp. DSM 44513]|uniref:hypothetical protein n=1 Tax=Geodermatophilus sp. DSM 44513 TaxID=1528104 RepID=UPI001283AAAD|nr:hypothetical protein [Geodermatophilus sp. DSM 44513]WNV74756.1 hypothetical protein RTG05_17430 [Geodermatophilus sp. DSM 44513]
MDPWAVLVVALLGSAGLVAVALGGDRPPSPRAAAPRAPRPAPRWRDDDLPGFLESPPGTPAVPVRPAPESDDRHELPAGPDGTRRVVAGMAAAALLLVAALAGVAAAARSEGPAPAAAPTPEPPVDLPPVPADPLPGEGGAGVLAHRSVPLGADGVAARLAFGGLVVEQRAVGTTVGYPSVSVTAGDAGALAHLLLPTWNCLGTEPPPDPVAAGCVRSRTEYADLPAPALSVHREGRDLRLAGRFPSYTRPVATPPAYTGRVYDLAVTVSPAGPVVDGAAPAGGTFSLGLARAGAVDEPGLGVVRYAG